MSGIATRLRRHQEPVARWPQPSLAPRLVPRAGAQPVRNQRRERALVRPARRRQAPPRHHPRPRRCRARPLGPKLPAALRATGCRKVAPAQRAGNRRRCPLSAALRCAAGRRLRERGRDGNARVTAATRCTADCGLRAAGCGLRERGRDGNARVTAATRCTADCGLRTAGCGLCKRGRDGTRE